MKLKYLLFLLCCNCIIYKTQNIAAQTLPGASVKKIAMLMDSTQKALPIEKLYIHFDKPYYAIGDTIWFKSYLMNAAYLTGSQLSGLLYMEFINEKNALVKRLMFPVAGGLSWGNIALDAKEFTKGKYRVNAYTNWMRNFGEDYIFKKDIYIGGATINECEVSSAVDLKKEPGKVHITLKFNQQDKLPLRLKPLELTVKNGAKVLYRKAQETNLDGATQLVFTLDADDVKNGLLLNAKEPKAENDGQEIFIPVASALQKDIDLQFMPEGGNIVAGLPAHIGFKAIGQDGRAAMINADVYDQHQNKITTITTGHGGMGTFDLIPKPAEKYTVSITFNNGQVKAYPLPVVKDFGTVLRVEDPGSDSLIVNISATPGGQILNTRYYIVGQARGVVCYAAAISITAGLLCVAVPKSAFPTGIGRFTLLDNSLRPLNERAVFIDHYDDLNISIKPNKKRYAKRDSVDLEVSVTDENGLPVAGNFSLAVTDNAQVKADTSHNIRSYMLLTSDLKGEVEEPSYYFKPDSAAKRKHNLDILMLTQGWVGYNWETVVKTGMKPAFIAQTDFKITGRIVNIFNKPLKNNHIVLLGKKPNLVRDTVTDTQGRFVFNNIIPVDTPAYILQARNKNGKSFNLAIELDDFKPPVFNAPVFAATLSNSTNDSTLLKYMGNATTRIQYNDNLYTKGHVLKNVTIKAKKIIKGSNNLNGSGNADIIIDQKELEKQDKKTLLQLLQENVKGFHVGSFIIVGNSDRANWDYFKSRVVTDTPAYLLPGKAIKYQVGVRDWYFIGDKPIKFLVDGTNPMFVYGAGPYSGSIVLKNYLTSNFAEDIKGLEVMISSDYSDKYIPAKYRDSISAGDFAFVEITTRSGHGPVIDNTIGRYLYKPMPFSVPSAFYRPKYTLKEKTALPDMRSTIHWEPNVVTGADGKAHVSFYASDSNAGYTVILQGSNMNGGVGYGVSSVAVQK